MYEYERLRKAVAALHNYLNAGKPLDNGPEFKELLDEFYAALDAVNEGSPQE